MQNKRFVTLYTHPVAQLCLPWAFTRAQFVRYQLAVEQGQGKPSEDIVSAIERYRTGWHLPEKEQVA